MIKLPKFENSLLRKKLLECLKLDFSNLDFTTQSSLEFKNSKLLDYEAHLYDAISEILNLPIDLKQKQEKLEKLAHENQNFQLNVEYYLPSDLTSIVQQIDFFFFNENYLYSDDCNYYLMSNINAKLNSKNQKERLAVNYLTKKNEQIIQKLKIILQLFKANDESFGLFLIYNFVFKIRSDVLSDNKSWSIADLGTTEISKNINVLSGKDLKKSIEQSDFIFLDLTFTALVSFLGKSLITHYNQCRWVTLSMLKHLAIGDKIHTDDYINLSEMDKNRLILENLDTKNQLVFNNLIELDKMSLSGEIEAELGLLCTLILQIIGIISEEYLEESDFKQAKLITLHTDYTESIFTIPASPRKLPMVVCPNPWKHEKEDQNLHFGGFMYNAKLNYPGVFNKHKKGIATFTQHELDAINFLQSNFYCINKEYLKTIEMNSRDAIRNYLKSIPHYRNFFTDPTFSSDFIAVKSFNQYLDTNSSYRDLMSQNNESISPSVRREIVKILSKCEEEYQTLFKLLIQFIHAYSISVLFQDYKLYFCIFLDARGRLYYTSGGGGFGLQAGGFGQHILELKGNAMLQNQSELDWIPSDEKVYSEYCGQVKPEDYFEYLKVTSGVPQTTVGKDASCSGTSIISGLIGNLKGMILTNVLYDKQNGIPTEKTDIYNFFGDVLTAKYPATFIELKPFFHGYQQFQNEKLKKKYQINEEEFATNVTRFLELIKPDILKRSSYKQFVMCKNYSQGDVGRSHYIYNNSNFFYSSENIFVQKDLNLYICRALGKWVAHCYRETFPDIDAFCALLLRSINHEKPVTLISGIHPSEQIQYIGKMQYQQLLEEVVSLRYPNVNSKVSGRTRKLNFSITTDNLDKRKAKQSLLANLIHFLDARLCLLVISKCKSQNIPIWTNHDCFYTHPRYITQVITCYFECYVSVLLEHELIYEFLAVNNSSLTKKDQDLLVKFKKSRQQVLKDITNQKLLMSPFCLN